MEHYAGLDVSLKAVSICVNDEDGQVLWRGEVVNDPDVVAAVLSRRESGDRLFFQKTFDTEFLSSGDTIRWPWCLPEMTVPHNVPEILLSSSP